MKGIGKVLGAPASRIVKGVVLACVALALLYLFSFNFYDNRWKTVGDQEWFNTWQGDSERLVVSKIYDAELHGVWNHAGMMPAYHQQSGLQAFGAGVGAALLGYRGNAVNYLHFGNSVLLSLVFLALAYWCAREFNPLAGASLLLAVFFSGWLTVAGRNLYWVLWTMYLPFLFVLFFLWKDRLPTGRHMVLLGAGCFLLALVRFMCGFEMTSSVLVAMELPVVYYAVKGRWGIKRFLQCAVVAGAGGLLAFVVAVAVFLGQLTLVYGDFSLSLEALLYTVSVRTGLFDREVAEVVRQSLQTPVGDVVRMYFGGERALVGTGLRMWHISLLTLFTAGLCLLDARLARILWPHRRKLGGLLAMVAVSYLGPLSWFVLAKGHSAIHDFINFILWYIPVVPLAFALMGACVGYGLQELLRRARGRAGT